jgi:hypothetical protein
MFCSGIHLSSCIDDGTKRILKTASHKARRRVMEVEFGRWGYGMTFTGSVFRLLFTQLTVDDFVAVGAHEFNRIQHVSRSAHKRFNVNYLQATKSHKFQPALESGSGPGGSEVLTVAAVREQLCLASEGIPVGLSRLRPTGGERPPKVEARNDPLLTTGSKSRCPWLLVACDAIWKLPPF